MNEKYRIKSISNFYIIEFKTREWFGLFGKYIWKPFKEVVRFHIKSGLPITEVVKHNSFDVISRKINLLNGI